MNDTTPVADDHGTQPGRDPVANDHGTQPGVVTNQPLLPLDPSFVATLDCGQRKELAIVQITFARDVSQLAADAYDRVLRLLMRGPG